MSVETTQLTHHFLIAMPAMEDPHFARALVYIAEHNEQGALGVIINRPIDMTLAELFERIDLHLGESTLASQPVFFGGPVATERGFVLHRPQGDWHSTIAVQDDIGLTSSLDILQALCQANEPQDVLVTLGYSGWSAGQLEYELAQNAWLSTKADPEVIFRLPPEERLSAAMQNLGVSYSSLNLGVGHA